MSTFNRSAVDDKPLSSADATPTSPRRGRPSRSRQAERREELLNTALDVFLERGFDQATVEEIAVRVGMSKRTVYAGYKDKAALFRVAVARAVELYTIPREAIETAVACDDLAATLKAVARMRIANVATPAGIRLQRILSSQAYRFPDLFDLAFEVGAGPAVEFLSDLFARRHAAGELATPEPTHAATAFLSLAVGGTTRLIVSGHALDDGDIERRLDFAVDLFLNGVRQR